MNNGIQVFIGGVEVVSNKIFKIVEDILATSSVILNNCYPLEWEQDHDYTSRFFMPKNYSKCTIYRNGNLIFAGVVKNTGNTLLRPTEPKYTAVEVLDYKTLLSEGQTLDFVITDKTIPQAIQEVVNAIQDYGFVLGNINISDTTSVIGAYSTLNKTPYDVFQYLAEISLSKWFTRRIDDDTIAIDFYDPDLMVQAPDIEYTQEYFEQNNIVDIKYSYSTNDYRNKQIILSNQVYASIDTQEDLFANGYQTAYLVSQEIGTLKHIYVNGVEKSFASINEKNMGIYADFYYQNGTQTIEASDTYLANTLISVEYTPIIKGRQVVFNNNEISRISSQNNRNGTISRYETRNDILTSDELDKVAQTYIKYKGNAEITLTITTKDVDLFNIGQQAYFSIPQFEELQQLYMVKRKETEITQTGEDAVIFYTYTLSSSFNSDQDINYFDNQRRKASGNISENEFITRNIDISNNVDIIFSDLEIIAIDGNNALNSILESPFVE